MASGENNAGPIANGNEPVIKQHILFSIDQANQLLDILADIPYRHKVIAEKAHAFLVNLFVDRTKTEPSDAVPHAES